MKKYIKGYKTIIQLISITVWVISLSLTSCGDSDHSKKITGTVTANAEGIILFMYSRTSANSPDFCKFTTDLPAPDNEFIVTITPGESTGKKEIVGLEAGRKVAWTATVEGKPLDHGSGNFVNIVNN